MQTNSKLWITLAFSALFGLSGCSSDSEPPGSGGTGGASGAGGGASGAGGGAANACSTDLPGLPSATMQSFVNDVMPVFGLSCTTSQCHDADAPAAQMYLGPRCKFDAATGGCVFNQEGQAPQEGIEMEDPLTADVINMVYGNIVGVPSATAPSLMRVAAGSPADSFLVLKITNTHQNASPDCMVTDPIAMGAGPCGDEMPPSSVLCDQGQGEAKGARAILIADWVAQGAPNN